MEHGATGHVTHLIHVVMHLVFLAWDGDELTSESEPAAASETNG